MIAVDASVVVSALVATDSHHAVSRDWLAAQLAAGEEVVAPLLLLVEVGAVIARRTGHSSLGHAAVQQVEAWPGLHLVPLDLALTRRATAVAVALRLRGADSLYVAVAERLSIPLVSWDAEHHARAGGRITVLYPDTPDAAGTP